MLAYSKALVPLVVAAVLGLLTFMGINQNMSVKDVVTLVATSVLVWFVPNKEV